TRRPRSSFVRHLAAARTSSGGSTARDGGLRRGRPRTRFPPMGAGPSSVGDRDREPSPRHTPFIQRLEMRRKRTPKPADVNRATPPGLCRVGVQVQGQMLTGARLDGGPRADARSRLLGELAAAPARKGYGIAYDLLGNRAEAEEAVQEALARACESIDDLRDPVAAPAWFLGTVA